jgi:hypothetical protein
MKISTSIIVSSILKNAMQFPYADHVSNSVAS